MSEIDEQGDKVWYLRLGEALVLTTPCGTVRVVVLRANRFSCTAVTIATGNVDIRHGRDVEQSKVFE